MELYKFDILEAKVDTISYPYSPLVVVLATSKKRKDIICVNDSNEKFKFSEN